MECHYDDDPFKIVMCRIPKRQREAFLNAIDMLPGLMTYVGKAGYDDYCMDFMQQADQYMKDRRKEGKITPLQ